MRIFLEKTVKNRRSVEGSAPAPPLASGDWKLCPETPALLLLPTITTLSGSFLALKCGLLPSKRTTVINFSKCSVFASSALLPLQFKLCSLCWQGAQKYFLPQGAGHPSYATAIKPLLGKKNGQWKKTEK